MSSAVRDRFAAHPDAETYLTDWVARVRASLKARGISANELATLLGDPNPDRIRRRLRGQSRFDVIEMLRIADGLDVPLEFGAERPPTLELVVDRATADAFEALAYVQSLLSLGRTIDGLRESGLPATAYVSTSDLPFTALCPYPLLAALHLFALEGGGGRVDSTFDYESMRCERPELFDAIAHMAELHLRANNVEVWGPTPLAASLATLHDLCSRRILSETTTREALDTFVTLVDDLREAARAGHKSGGGRFKLYAHAHAGNAPNIVIEAPGLSLTFHTLWRPYFAVSRQPATAALFRRMFDERCAEARPIHGRAPYAYRDYTDDLFLAITEARARLCAPEPE